MRIFGLNFVQLVLSLHPSCYFTSFRWAIPCFLYILLEPLTVGLTNLFWKMGSMFLINSCSCSNVMIKLTLFQFKLPVFVRKIQSVVKRVHSHPINYTHMNAPEPLNNCMIGLIAIPMSEALWRHHYFIIDYSSNCRIVKGIDATQHHFLNARIIVMLVYSIQKGLLHFCHRRRGRFVC